MKNIFYIAKEPKDFLVGFISGVLFILTTIIFCSCDSPQPKNHSKVTKNGDYTIKVIDDCEYIEYDYGIFDQRVYSLTHKGNCKFCAERNKKK